VPPGLQHADIAAGGWSAARWLLHVGLQRCGAACCAVSRRLAPRMAPACSIVGTCCRTLAL